MPEGPPKPPPDDVPQRTRTRKRVLVDTLPPPERVKEVPRKLNPEERDEVERRRAEVPEFSFRQGVEEAVMRVVGFMKKHPGEIPVVEFIGSSTNVGKTALRTMFSIGVRAQGFEVVSTGENIGDISPLDRYESRSGNIVRREFEHNDGKLVLLFHASTSVIEEPFDTKYKSRVREDEDIAQFGKRHNLPMAPLVLRVGIQTPKKRFAYPRKSEDVPTVDFFINNEQKDDLQAFKDELHKQK